MKQEDQIMDEDWEIFSLFDKLFEIEITKFVLIS